MKFSFTPDDDDALPDNPPARPIMEAQRMELVRRFDAYGARSTMNPGDLVREKRGLGVFKAARRPVVDDDGASVSFMPHELAQLEPDTDDGRR